MFSLPNSGLPEGMAYICLTGAAPLNPAQSLAYSKASVNERVLAKEKSFLLSLLFIVIETTKYKAPLWESPRCIAFNILRTQIHLKI